MDIGSLAAGAAFGVGVNIVVGFLTRPERDGDRRAGACDRRQAACDAVHRKLTDDLTLLKVQQGENSQMFKHISEQLAQGHRNFEVWQVASEELRRAILELKMEKR